jgi:HAD superfamily hydrolase (TIGR01459 family)
VERGVRARTSRRSIAEPARTIPILPGIASLASGTAAWLVDLWGVVHNGVAPFAPAVAACRRYRREGGLVLLLSNAPRPRQSVATQLDRIGVPPEAWDAIVSSGDAARALIADLGRAAVFHLGPKRDLPLYEGLEVRLTSAETAEIVVCTGLFDDEKETPEHYALLLADLRARDLPMICANPDLHVERGSRIVYCAGGLAQAYVRIGGRVTYAGKPYPLVYDMAFAELARLEGRPLGREEVLAIGDGIRTDIAGAAAAGLRSVYVASGVHAGAGALDPDQLAGLFPEGRPWPVAAMAALAW